MIRKNSEAAFRIKNLEEIIAEKETIILRKDKEIKEIKTECAEQFKIIRDNCVANEYSGLNDKSAKLRKICEIADNNYVALLNDLIIDNEEEVSKIIELSTNRKTRR